jgi:hypothetical protein
MQRGKRLTIKLESNRQHAAVRRVGALDNIADLFEPPRVLKINRFLGIDVKPEEWRYASKMFESAYGNHLICECCKLAKPKRRLGRHSGDELIYGPRRLHNASEVYILCGPASAFIPRKDGLYHEAEPLSQLWR